MFFYRFRGAILSWIMVPLALIGFLFSFYGLIGAAYHPEAPNVHLVPARIVLSGVSLIAFLFFAVFHSFASSRTRVFRNILHLSAVFFVPWGVFQLLAATTGPPDALQKIYRGEAYSIPRIYKPSQFTREDGTEYIDVSICLKTGKPVYAASCSSWSSVSLRTEPMTKQFDIYCTLDGAGAEHEDDVILDFGEGATFLPDGSFFYESRREVNRFLLDHTGQIMRFSKCRLQYGRCAVSVRTEKGILNFGLYPLDASFDSLFWG